MTVVELFAGVGGFRLGLEGLSKSQKNGKFKVVFANQWEPSTKRQHAVEVYTNAWGLKQQDSEGCMYVNPNSKDDILVNRDICKLDTKSIPDHDLLVGGFPCQDYSVAKTLDKSKGISGKKGVLWWEIHRIVSEKNPNYILLENVDRLLKSPSKQRGRDFAVMLASLSDLGYRVEWRVIDASEYGFPQRRKRVFIFAEKSSKFSFPLETLQSEGILSRSFPIHELNDISTFNLGDVSLSDITISFNSDNSNKKTPFGNIGVMSNREITTAKCKANYNGKLKTLGDILFEPELISNQYILSQESLIRKKGWIYLKGAKSELRKRPDGFTYKYSEGPVTFPDSIHRASRTIITGEGGISPSRFKHVVKFKPTKSQIENLKLNSSQCNEVREKLSMSKSEWLRRLMPVELERLNGFPDNHTGLASDGKRAFFMGNALVVGIISKIGDTLYEYDCSK